MALQPRALQLPASLLEPKAGPLIYAGIELRLRGLDACVERWRREHLPGARACTRCGSMSAYADLVRIHSELISRLPGGCRVVCETGFNRGDSALVMATACGPAAQCVSFTLDSHWHTRPGLGCLEEASNHSGHSFTYVEGFSAASMPDFIGRNAGAGRPLRCDVIHVDGGKGSQARLQDLVHFRGAAHNGTLWITDDVDIDTQGRYCVRSSGLPPWKARSCRFEVFVQYMQEVGLEVRCQANGQHAQCYGHRQWDALLHGA